MTALVDHVVHGDVHELRLARPPVNALDPALCAALAGAIDDALARGAAGTLRAVVDRAYPLDRVADAHRHVEHEHKAGTVVVTLG